jgi:hypothetical protein
MGASYLDMLENFVFPRIAKVYGLIFLQDGTPYHLGYILCTALDERFPGRWIKRGELIKCPLWSLDLTPMDFYCGYINDIL